MKKIILMSFSFVLFVPCGNNSNNTKNEDLPINVPEKIDIKTPDALKGTRSSENSKSIFQKTSDSTSKSKGYESIQSDIKNAEEFILKTNQSLIKYKTMMPNILESCIDTKINEQCTIIEPKFTNLNINKITYTHNDEEHTFQYTVTLYFPFESELIRNTETLKWSQDNGLITTIEDKEREDDRARIQLDYQKKNDGVSNMKIREIFGSHKYEYGEYSFNIENLNDINKTINIQTNIFAIYDGLKEGYSIDSSITKNGGYLTYKENSPEKTSIEKEYFDATGKLLVSKFCYSSENNCQIDEESTWNTYSSSNDNYEELLPDENTNTYDFDVNGGELYSGYCELVPPSFEITATTDLEDILSNVVAAIVKNGTNSEGILYDKNYLNELNSLKIICFTDTEYKNYIELLGADKPTLTPYQSNTH